MKTCNYLIQSKRCVICYEPIGIEEYEYSITKPKTVNKKNYSYTLKNGLKQLKQAQKKSKTSLKSQNNDQSTLDQYTTDAPELKGVTLKFPTK